MRETIILFIYNKFQSIFKKYVEKSRLKSMLLLLFYLIKRHYIVYAYEVDVNLKKQISSYAIS